MFLFRTLALAPLLLILSATLTNPQANAQSYPPSIDFESALDTFFGASNGTIRFDQNVVAFIPEDPFVGQVAVLNANGDVVSQFSYLDTVLREGVFGRVQINGFAETQLTEPGIYTIVYVVNNQPVTRLPVRLVKAEDSTDPFNPKATYHFDGHWRTMAHITINSNEPEPIPELNFWVGGIDLPAGSKKDQFQIELIRDGNVIAHNRYNSGHIAEGHFKRTNARLFHPHAEKETQNARPFTQSDWLVDGEHEVKITRRSDGKMIRSFDFTVADQKIVPLKQTDLKYDPHVDFILPKVVKKNANVFEMIDTTWIRDGGNGPADTNASQDRAE